MDTITSHAVPSIKPLEAGTLLNNVYLIDSLQGQGRYGLVYLATDQRSEESVALKEVCTNRPDQKQKLKQLEHELSETKSLKHPNITKCLDFFYDNGRFFIVMEWFDGDSLNNAITYQKLSIAKKYYIAQQVLEAIAFATQHGYTHGALSLDNIMINKSGKAVIVDYGLQLLTPDLSADVDISQLNPIPPEDIKAQSVSQSDWYAFGNVLFELLNKTNPFSSKSVNLHYQSKLSLTSIRKYNQFSNLNPLLEALLAPSPHKRLNEAASIQREFDKAITNKGNNPPYLMALIALSLCAGLIFVLL